MINWEQLRRQHLDAANEDILPKDWELPVFPQSVSEFVRLADKDGTSIKQLAEVLEVDHNMTVELLRHVNSASFGRRHKANTVLQALTHLGVRRSKLFLLTAAVQSSMSTVKTDLINLPDFWSSNLERGMFAREMAEKMGCDVDLAYTGAILQDFLLPILFNYHRKSYVEYSEEGLNQETELIHYERGRLGIDHALAAAACMLGWSFPDDLICCVLLHHLSPEQMEEQGLKNTAVDAIALSSMIPSVYPQNPHALQWLIKRDRSDQRFDLFDVAEAVDEQMGELEQQFQPSIPLMDRMEQQLTEFVTNEAEENAYLKMPIGPYKLTKKIGNGAMGVVFQGQHNRMPRPVAVKILNKIDATAEKRQQFEREVALTCQLEHENTIKIYDFGPTPDGALYYAMEYIDGISLKNLVQTFGPMPEERVIPILKQVCGSLAEAHQMGLIHRDIKPDNLMLTHRANKGDHVKVVDFGLVRSSKGDEGEQKGITGTPAYLAPEAIDHPEQADPRSDLYAIAAVGYFLLTGEPLFTGNSIIDVFLQQVNDRPMLPSRRLGKPISNDLERLIMTGLSKKPEQRPQTAHDYEQLFGLCNCKSEWSTEHAQKWWETYQYQTQSGQVSLASETPTCEADKTVIMPEDTAVENAKHI